MPNRIDEVYLFLAVNPDDGTEGIVGYAPLMGFGDITKAELISLAQKVANHMQTTIRIVRFTSREFVQEIPPLPSKGNA